MLEIGLLGGFRLVYEGVLKYEINTPRMVSLLSYLLIYRETPQQRRHLAYILWPDSSEAQARTNLRKLLYQLRQILPNADTYIDFEGQTIRWKDGTDLSLDVAAIQAAIDMAAKNPASEQRQLELAAKLYRGDLLPEIYDEWIEPERERLRAQFATVLERLILLYESKRSYPEAIYTAQRLLQCDSLNEKTYRDLMRMHALNNDRTSALRVYHNCVNTLMHELAVEPDKETRELYQRLLQDESSDSVLTSPAVLPVSIASRSIPLVGREQEWQTLLKLWNNASPGQPFCLILLGEAGIGKTRLAEEFLGWIRQQGVLTATARCIAGEGSTAYAPVAEWLRSDAIRSRWKDIDRPWLIELARLIPELQSENPDLPQPGLLAENWQRRRMFEALLRAIIQARPAPTALFLDDLQWCDRETLDWMSFLLCSTLPSKLIIVCTLRIEELSLQRSVSTWLMDQQAGGRLKEISLLPLSAAETAELASHVSGKVLDADSAMQLFAETEGHPLYVIEAMRMASETPMVQNPLDHPAGSTGLPSPTIQAVISRRLAQLSPAARDLASVAAVIGRSFSYKVLSKASLESDEILLVRSLDELWQRRIIREQGSEAYDFSHDKIREVVYQSLSAARRRLLHRQIAEILVNSLQGNYPRGEIGGGNLVRQTAVHFDQAGVPEQAILYYHQAAKQARDIFANEESLSCYRRMLELVSSASGQESTLVAEISEEMGDLLLLLTRREEARAAFELALSRLPTIEQVRHSSLIRKIGNTWRDEHRFEESLPVYGRALEILGDPPDGDSQLVQDWWQSWIQIQIDVLNVYYWLGWIEKMDVLDDQINAVIGRYGTSLQRASFYAILSFAENRRCRYLLSDKGLDFIRAAYEAHRQAGTLESTPSAMFLYGFGLLLHGDLEEAEPELIAAMRIAEQHGDLSLLSRCITYLTILHRKLGNLGRVMELAVRGLKIAQMAQMPEYSGAAHANLAWAAWRANDFLHAREHSQAALKLWKQSPGVQVAAIPYYWTAIWPLIQIAMAEGDKATAVEHLRDLLQPHRKRLPESLTAAMSDVVQAWDAGQDVKTGLGSVVALAEKLREI